MESQKRRRGRPAGRSLDALEVDKLNRSIWSGARCRVWLLRRSPQYVGILEREKLLQQRLRLRSTFALTGDADTREASYKFSFWFLLKEIWILVLFGSIIYHTPLFDSFLLSQKLGYEVKQNRSWRGEYFKMTESKLYLSTNKKSLISARFNEID